MATQEYIYVFKVIPLNKSRTKQVCCGLKYVDKKFQPTIQIIATHPRSVIELNLNEWKKVCDSSNTFSNYFYEEVNNNFYRKFCLIEYEDLKIEFSEFKGERCIILSHRKVRICLLGSTAGALKLSCQRVNQWLNHLEQLPVEGYINSLEENISGYILKNLMRNIKDTPKTSTVMGYFEKYFFELYKYNERAPFVSTNLGDLGLSFFWELLYYHDDLVQRIIRQIDYQLSLRYTLYYSGNDTRTDGIDTCY